MFYFHPYLGKVSNLTSSFQMGWFNHQLEDGGLSFLSSWNRRSTKADHLGQCYMESCDGFQLAEGTIKHYLYYLDSESTARCEDSVVKCATNRV